MVQLCARLRQVLHWLLVERGTCLRQWPLETMVELPEGGGNRQLTEATSQHLALAAYRPLVSLPPSCHQAKAALEMPTLASCEPPGGQVDIAPWRCKTADGACSRAW